MNDWTKPVVGGYLARHDYSSVQKLVHGLLHGSIKQVSGLEDIICHFEITHLGRYLERLIRSLWLAFKASLCGISTSPFEL